MLAQVSGVSWAIADPGSFPFCGDPGIRCGIARPMMTFKKMSYARSACIMGCTYACSVGTWNGPHAGVIFVAEKDYPFLGTAFIPCGLTGNCIVGEMRRWKRKGCNCEICVPIARRLNFDRPPSPPCSPPPEFAQEIAEAPTATVPAMATPEISEAATAPDMTERNESSSEDEARPTPRVMRRQPRRFPRTFTHPWEFVGAIDQDGAPSANSSTATTPRGHVYLTSPLHLGRHRRVSNRD